MLLDAVDFSITGACVAGTRSCAVETRTGAVEARTGVVEARDGVALEAVAVSREVARLCTGVFAAKFAARFVGVATRVDPRTGVLSSTDEAMLAGAAVGAGSVCGKPEIEGLCCWVAAEFVCGCAVAADTRLATLAVSPAVRRGAPGTCVGSCSTGSVGSVFVSAETDRAINGFAPEFGAISGGLIEDFGCCAVCGSTLDRT